MKVTKKGARAYEALAGLFYANHDRQAAKEDLSRLSRYAATLSRLGVEECNGDGRHLFPDQGSWREDLERQTKAAENMARRAAEALPSTDQGRILLGLDGDPRGEVLYLILPGTYKRTHSNSFCGERFLLV